MEHRVICLGQHSLQTLKRTSQGAHQSVCAHAFMFACFGEISQEWKPWTIACPPEAILSRPDIPARSQTAHASATACGFSAGYAAGMAVTSRSISMPAAIETSAPPPASRVARSAAEATAGAAGTSRARRAASASGSSRPSVSPIRRHSRVRVGRFGTFNSRHIVIRRSTAGPSTPISFAVQITGTAMRSSRRCMNTRELATGSSKSPPWSRSIRSS